MALIQVNFYSEKLRRTVPINAIIPTDKTLFTKSLSDQEGYKPPKKYKTLYLLHGGLGNYTDWVGGTRVQVWAQDKDLAVIMPSGDNKFYVDNADARELYGEFIGKELVEFTRKTFPLSDKREDTFIAGLSMGGYGATVNGLKYHETFSHIGALSSGYILDDILEARKNLPFMSSADADENLTKYWTSILGDLSKLEGSDKDYNALIRKLAEEKKDIPKIYMACGESDFILEKTRAYKKVVEAAGADLTYEEGPGGHDWEFWDTFIKKFIDWLPLGEAVKGIGSGHVRED